MQLSDIHTIGNLGAGTMGRATALQFAWAGYPVYLVDTSEDALKQGMASIQDDLATFVSVGVVEESDVPAIMARITPTQDQELAFSHADFVIENVPENLGLKQKVWAQVEAIAPETAILATNTSGLSPTQIAASLKHPERFVVAHFFNPAHLMPLVEVVPGAKTAPETVTLTVDLMNHIGKHAVPLKKEAPGFVGNRIQMAVGRELMHIVDEGIATPEATDEIMKYSLGRRWAVMGPTVSADLGGLDIFAGVSQYLLPLLDNTTTVNPLLADKVKKGELGLKTGKGFFDWTPEKARKIVQQRDKALLRMLAEDKQDEKDQTHQD
ncbi:3-hydroxyacyl-CoA dehydrogenase family protein [Schleiferilactobacillus shenzhenensis]|uniref:L-gulonate 3-dehydrogenase n=1 Tax=Schleiferilactobacillus shenzhenensis LY-73 TaxID=1231336 RepID=U4TRZ1_9LACO|nr:3-hydroxyacyl-CoA dehydrogenase family protein [Schleiferilactobacillus shenzhenensis]ERL64257.1 3-hydroxybutyryl-CoA dehydrogenase [Schleiferilactobacillus shenzhenensis LY-73]